MMFVLLGLIQSAWLSPWGTVGMGRYWRPPSTDLYRSTLLIHTVFSSRGSAVMRM